MRRKSANKLQEATKPRTPTIHRCISAMSTYNKHSFPVCVMKNLQSQVCSLSRSVSRGLGLLKFIEEVRKTYSVILAFSRENQFVSGNGKIKIWVDYKKLNHSVMREQFIMPTVDEISAKITG